jgi:hypothetical protein
MPFRCPHKRVEEAEINSNPNSLVGQNSNIGPNKYEFTFVSKLFVALLHCCLLQEKLLLAGLDSFVSRGRNMRNASVRIATCGKICGPFRESGLPLVEHVSTTGTSCVLA